MSYSNDLSLTLSHSLTSLTPGLIASPPPTPVPSANNDFTIAGRPRASPEAVEDRVAILRSTLSTITSAKKPPTLEKLADLVEATFPPFQGLSSVPLTPQLESIELLVLAQLTIAAYGLALGTVVEEATALGREDDYWAQVESDRWNMSMFLLQTAPTRLVGAATASFERVRHLQRTNMIGSFASVPSVRDLRQALPPSLLLTSMFPHLTSSISSSSQIDPLSDSPTTSSTAAQLRRLLFLSLSPLKLGGQEVALKRKQIQKAREDFAEKIGVLALLKSGEEPGLRGLLASSGVDPTIESIQEGTYSTLRLLDSTLSPSPTMPPTPPSNPSDLAHSLQHLLSRTIPLHLKSTKATLSKSSRPGVLTRSWPKLVSIPLGSIILARVAYNSRETLYRWATTAQETAKGFILDWVIEPLSNILATIRGGDDGAQLMPKESLKSDLDSLERMVVEFGRDQYKMGPEELKELGDKVRVGDLTSVLKVWEQDIKSPIRSAVTGSLIRTLLIQVQKVKVDTLVMVNGIEKMLHSQQLTFAFVGVAPSLIILVGLGQWLRGMLRRDGGKAGKRDIRKRCWATMRHLDELVSSRATKSNKAQTQGFLLLELDALRAYAYSRYFPTRDTQLRDSFLTDVRALEDSTEGRKDLVNRLWRWGTVLGWNEIL